MAIQVTIRCITDAVGHWINVEDLVDALQMRESRLRPNNRDRHWVVDMARSDELNYIVEVIKAACPPQENFSVDETKRGG